jgi:hypothetical protein
MDRILQRLAFWAVIAAVTASAIVAGLIVRRAAWDSTETIRFTEDINNAFRQGSAALRVGYLNRYDQDKTDPNDRFAWMPLDYAPGRLAVATLWTHWVRNKVEGPPSAGDQVEQWPMEFYERARLLRQTYQLCKPMLMVNLTGEILSSIAIFLLVQRYTGSRNRPEILQPVLRTLHGAIWAVVLWCALGWLLHTNGFSLKFSWQLPAVVWLWFAFPLQRSTIGGLVAAVFFWFNPALIWNAHAWPQWDSWVLPFFLWAIYAASCDCWLIAGCLIASGAMFKGQILFGAPIFFLWPLWQLRLLAIVRWLVGLATAIAAITAVWLVRTAGAMPSETFIPGHMNMTAIGWVASMTIAFSLMVLLLRIRWAWYATIPFVAVVIGLISWRFFQIDTTPQWLPGVWFTIAWAAVVPALLWSKWIPYVKIPAVVIVTVFIALGLWRWNLEWLREMNALLLAAGGFVLGAVLFPECTVPSKELAAEAVSPVKTASAAQAVGPVWRCYAMRAAGIVLAVLLLLVQVPPALSPLLFASAVVMSGAILFWCSFQISTFTWRARLPFGWLLTSLVLWPFLHLAQGLMISAAADTFRVGLIVYYAPRRAVAYTAAGWMAAALLLCIPLFDGSRTWFDTGFASPTTHREAMASGENDNLADILEQEWGWQTMEPVMTLQPGPVADSIGGFLRAVDPKYHHRAHESVQLPMKYLLVSFWISALLLSSIGAAIQDSVRGPRFLVAISAPWIAMFALLAQMHQRYLLWGATLSSASASLNPGYALLHLLVSVIAMSQEMQSMFERDRRYFHTFVVRIVDGWHPGIGWAVLLMAIIFVYLAVRPVRSRNAGDYGG